MSNSFLGDFTLWKSWLQTGACPQSQKRSQYLGKRQVTVLRRKQWGETIVSVTVKWSEKWEERSGSMSGPVRE